MNLHVCYNDMWQRYYTYTQKNCGINARDSYVVWYNSSKNKDSSTQTQKAEVY